MPIGSLQEEDMFNYKQCRNEVSHDMLQLHISDDKYKRFLALQEKMYPRLQFALERVSKKRKEATDFHESSKRNRGNNDSFYERAAKHVRTYTFLIIAIV